MNLLVKVVVAILIGVLVTWVLDFFGVLTHGINALLGLLSALVFFFTYDGTRRV